MSLEIKKWNISINSDKKGININIWITDNEKIQNIFFELPSKIDSKTTPEKMLEIFVEVFKKYSETKKN